MSYKGLTVDFCKEINVEFILRGLRNPADFEFEKAIAHTNRDLAPIETVFLLTSAGTSYIASSIVRDVTPPVAVSVPADELYVGSFSNTPVVAA